MSNFKSNAAQFISKLTPGKVIVGGILAFVAYQNLKDETPLLDAQRAIDNYALQGSSLPDSKTYTMLAADTADGKFYAQLLKSNQKDTAYLVAPIVTMTNSMASIDKQTEYRIKYNADLDTNGVIGQNESMEIQHGRNSMLNDDKSYDNHPARQFKFNRDMMTQKHADALDSLFSYKNHTGRAAIYIDDYKIDNKKPAGFKL